MNKEDEWNENKLSGNSAENLVEYLINSIEGWECHKFGAENNIRLLIDNMKGLKNPISFKIRKMPDFFVFNKEKNEAFFVEVKFSSNSERKGYLLGYLENYRDYWAGTKMIIVRVNKPYLVCVDLDKIDDSMRTSKQINGEWKASWDFSEVEQDIKELFPDLTDESLERAKGMIN